MMESYLITDLLWFWIQGYNDDFNVIKSIIKVIRNDNMSDEEKRELVIDVLRYYGLYEVGYIGERTRNLQELRKPTEQDEQSSKRTPDRMESVLVPMELFSCTIMNAEIQFEIVLN